MTPIKPEIAKPIISARAVLQTKTLWQTKFTDLPQNQQAIVIKGNMRMSRLAKKIASVSVLMDVIGVAFIKLNKLKLISFSKVESSSSMYHDHLY